MINYSRRIYSIQIDYYPRRSIQQLTGKNPEPVPFLKPQVNVYRFYKFYIHSITDHICKFSRIDYMCKHLFTRRAPLGCRLKSSPTSMVVPYFKIISLSCEVLFYMYIMDHTIYMRKRLPLWLFWKQHYTQYHNGCGFIYNKKRLTVKNQKDSLLLIL